MIETTLGLALIGLVIAGITFAVEKLVTPLGNFGKLLYAVAAILVIIWAIKLLLGAI